MYEIPKEGTLLNLGDSKTINIDDSTLITSVKTDVGGSTKMVNVDDSTMICNETKGN